MNRKLTSHEVCSLICECEETGARLVLDAAGAPSIAGVDLVPAELLQRLRNAKNEIREYFVTFAPLAMTDIPFVSKRLDILILDAKTAGESLYVFIGSVPYYRLTPDVFVWCRLSIDPMYEQYPTEIEKALPVLDSLGVWVSTHYRPHDIAGAFARRGSLPNATMTDLPNPVHKSVEDWLQQWKGK